MVKCGHENSRSLIEAIVDKKPGTRGVHQFYDQNPKELYENISNVIKGLDNLPQDYERLPAFAHRITKDPHGFDIGSDQGRLFILALKILRQQKEEVFQEKSYTFYEKNGR